MLPKYHGYFIAYSHVPIRYIDSPAGEELKYCLRQSGKRLELRAWLWVIGEVRSNHPFFIMVLDVPSRSDSIFSRKAFEPKAGTTALEFLKNIKILNA